MLTSTRLGRTLWMLIAVSLLSLAACSTSSVSTSALPTATIPAKWQAGDPHTGDPTVTPPANLIPRRLPSFADPRVAYIGPDSLLHVVSLDGKRDLVGTPIPLAGFVEEGIWAAGTSPDGKHLAFLQHSQTTVIDAASGTRSTAPTPGVGDSTVGWSPDQRYLALRYFGAIECVTIATGRSFVTPKDTLATNTRPLVDGPYGWLDATHVAVRAIPDTSSTAGTHALATPVPSAQTRITLESLDVTTNQLRPIVTLHGYGNAGFFSILPDGRWTLFVNQQDAQQPVAPFTPFAALIDNMTGTVMPLHHLISLLPQGIIYSLLWRPGSAQAIVAGAFGPGKAADYLIDALHDTAMPITLPDVPVAWSPDGSTLVVATAAHAITEESPGWDDVGAVGAGPFTLLAVRVGNDGSTSPVVTLTSQAMNIPLLGFVHTA